MNKKAVVFLAMVGIIVVLLGINILIFKGREDEITFKMDNQEQNVLNVEEETESVVSEVDKEISSAEQNTQSPYFTIVLDKEAASSLAAELATASDVQHVIFCETYYESDELEIEGESESESESVAR